MTATATRQRFEAMVTRAALGFDFAEAALLVAAEEYPDLNVGRYLARLDEMGALARERIPEAEPLALRLSALNRYLFGQEGFRGNSAEYYDPRNSFLNEVLDRKMGIPLSLSAVYLEVGRRSGLDLSGISFPGHFLVRAGDAEDDVIVDPFHEGALLSAEDCQKRLDRVYDGKLKLEPQMLEPVGPRPMLERLLRNLKSIYIRAEDYRRALGVLDLLLILDPRSAEDLRDRGLVYAALDCYAVAAADLEAHLVASPETADAAKVVSKIVELRRLAARLN